MATNGKVSSDQRYTASHPCPICGGHEGLPRGRGERCTGYLAGSGKFAFCERTEAPETIETAAGTLFKHRLDHVDRRERPAPKKDGKPRRKGHRTPQEAIKSFASWHKRERYDLGSLAKDWTYHDRDGRAVLVIYRFERIDPETGEVEKDYRPAGRTPDGWIAADKHLDPLPLYHLPDLIGAGLVVICEGEKAADAVRSLGLVGTSPAHGGDSPQRTDWSPLAGKDVVILPDNDATGRKFADHVVELLSALDSPPTIKVVELPGLPPKGDAFDWVEAGGTAEYLLDLVEAAEPIERQPRPERPGALTDLGNCERFARDHERHARHVGSWKKWLVYAGGRWIEDDTGAVMRLAKQTVRGIAAEATEALDPDEFKSILKWAIKSEDARQIANMVRLAESEKRLAVSHRKLNADPWLFNVRNGTIDLRTGELRPHDRGDLITHLSPVEFDRAATCPLWESELETVFAGDAELIGFFRRLAGYWMTAVVWEQILPIAFGKGRNGKSTVLGTLLRIFGENYSYEADPELIMQSSGSRHPTEKASLFGKRLVSLSETDAGKRLNESLVKRLTGKEQIRARRMREDEWSFWPTHKLILSTNHRPEIRGTDTAIWRRVLLIPFTHTIDPKDEIPDFASRLQSEDAGILAWCVRGCLEWQRDGLRPPESVIAATKEYRESQDTIAAFVAERCFVGKEFKERSGEFFKAYADWCKENGEDSLGSRTFYETMAERGFTRKVGHGNRSFLHGIGLRRDSE